MSTPKGDEKSCPVCTKGESTDGLYVNVSHLDCAISEHEARLQAEAELHKWRTESRNETVLVEEYRAENARLKEVCESNQRAWVREREKVAALAFERDEAWADIDRRAWRFDHDRGVRYILQAAVQQEHEARLRAEAENDQWAERWTEVAKERNAAEAELAALKAQRCETCTDFRIAPEFATDVPLCWSERAVESCSRWQPREDPK